MKSLIGLLAVGSFCLGAAFVHKPGATTGLVCKCGSSGTGTDGDCGQCNTGVIKIPLNCGPCCEQGPTGPYCSKKDAPG